MFFFIRFEDFDIDQFVDYLQNDDDIVSNSHLQNEPTPSPVPQSGYINNLHEPSTQSIVEKFFYTCTVCREILANSQDLLKHVRTHTKLKEPKCNGKQKVSHSDLWVALWNAILT
jgi:hypothetical protein